MRELVLGQAPGLVKELVQELVRGLVQVKGEQ